MKKSEFTTKKQVVAWYYKKTNENFLNILLLYVATPGK
jgi:hypothetical protein